MRRPIALSNVSNSSIVVNFEARTTACTSAAVASATLREPVICLHISEVRLSRWEAHLRRKEVQSASVNRMAGSLGFWTVNSSA